MQSELMRSSKAYIAGLTDANPFSPTPRPFLRALVGLSGVSSLGAQSIWLFCIGD